MLLVTHRSPAVLWPLSDCELLSDPGRGAELEVLLRRLETSVGIDSPEELKAKGKLLPQLHLACSSLLLPAWHLPVAVCARVVANLLFTCRVNRRIA